LTILPASRPRLKRRKIADKNSGYRHVTATLAAILPFSRQRRPNIARDCCEIFHVAGDSPAHSRISAMIRSPGTAGFDGLAAPVASSKLTHAVAASLVIGALSLCLIVTLTVLSTKVTMAMPMPA
jgi:hypothetical protein